MFFLSIFRFPILQLGFSALKVFASPRFLLQLFTFSSFFSCSSGSLVIGDSSRFVQFGILFVDVTEQRIRGRVSAVFRKCALRFSDPKFLNPVDSFELLSVTLDKVSRIHAASRSQFLIAIHFPQSPFSDVTHFGFRLQKLSEIFLSNPTSYHI